MGYQRKSWREKLADDKDLPKIFRITGRQARKWGDGTVVIPAPREVDGLMRTVRKGRLITINELRAALARQHGATMGCFTATKPARSASAVSAGKSREWPRGC